jgi:hypothetical protein
MPRPPCKRVRSQPGQPLKPHPMLSHPMLSHPMPNRLMPLRHPPLRKRKPLRIRVSSILSSLARPPESSTKLAKKSVAPP